MNWKKNMKPVDFSIRHNIMLSHDRDISNVLPMDEPFFEARKLAEGTWQVFSCGDFTYVVEGQEETLVIDSGYGCGNIREFCQGLTDKPVYRIANTHDHVDHTANNYLFDAAYMSRETYEKRSLPFPSFAGIDFPRDYPTVIIEEGYLFDLGGRILETFAFKGHAAGSLGWLDRKERMFFTGDEFVPDYYHCRYSVAHGVAMYQKLIDHLDEFDFCCGGAGLVSREDIVKGYKALLRVLEHHEEEWDSYESRFAGEEQLPELTDSVTVLRQAPRPWDKPRFRPNPDDVYKRNFTLDGFTVSFHIRHIYE